MATQESLDLAQTLYVAYYGRPADRAGLNYWADEIDANGVDAMVNAFGNSAEFEARFGNLSDDQLVTNLYQQMFGRLPEIAGLDFYTNQLRTGESTLAEIALDIANGAQNEDVTALNNKVAVAANFTAAIDTTEEVLAYSGNDAANAARDFLAGIDENTDVDAVDVDAQLAQLVANDEQNPGETFTLTTGIDAGTAFTGTSGDDKYIGTIGAGATLQTADQVNAGEGTDRLEIYSDGTAATLPVMTSVEDLYIKSISTAEIANLDYAAVAGLKTIEVDTGITDVNGASTATVAQGQTLTLDSVKDGEVGTAGDDQDNEGELEINSAASVTDVSLVLDDAGVAEATTADGDLDLEVLGAGVKNINIATSGAASFISLAVNGTSALETLTLSGDQALTVTNNIDFKGTTSGTVNAQALSGNLSLQLATGEAITFTGGSGTNTVVAGAGNDNLTGGAKADIFTTGAGVDTVNTGAGDDTIIVAGNLTKADKIDGGEGTDTLVTSEITIDAVDKAAAAGVSNVEVFGTDAAGDISVDFNALADFDTVAITAAAANGAVTATMENDDTLVVSAARESTDSSTSAISIAPEVDGGSNAASLKLVGNADLKGTDYGLSAGNVETLNLDIAGTKKTGTADDVVIEKAAAGDDVLIGTNAQIVVTSSLEADATINNNLDLGNVAGNNATINASAFQGNLTVTADDGNVTITGGAGNDVLGGGAGQDTINGGAGNDQITAAGGADIVDLGAGRDYVTVASNSDADAISNDSAEAAYDKISNFSLVSEAVVNVDFSSAANFQGSTAGGSNVSILNFALTEDDGGAGAGNTLANTIETDKTAANIEGSITGVSTTVNGVVKDGILTLTGDGASAVDTLAEWVDAAGAVAATKGETLAFEFDGNTYAFADNGTQDVLVELTGVTGVAGVGLADASTDAQANWMLVG